MPFSLSKLLLRAFGFLVVELPARWKNMATIIKRLEANGKRQAQQLHQIRPTAENREIVRHVICIERWGQSRLEVLLGEPLKMDESDGYAPEPDLSLAELQQAFVATRERTVGLARQLQNEPRAQAHAPHNDSGPLSARGWLRYLLNHARKELREIEGFSVS